VVWCTVVVVGWRSGGRQRGTMCLVWRKMPDSVRHLPSPLQQDTIPHAVICSLTLLMMENVCPKHVELILKINKYCYLLHLVRLLDFIYIAYTLWSLKCIFVFPFLIWHDVTFLQMLSAAVRDIYMDSWITFFPSRAVAYVHFRNVIEVKSYEVSLFCNSHVAFFLK
jgi:hypothetical protein